MATNRFRVQASLEGFPQVEQGVERKLTFIDPIVNFIEWNVKAISSTKNLKQIDLMVSMHVSTRYPFAQLSQKTGSVTIDGKTRIKLIAKHSSCHEELKWSSGRQENYEFIMHSGLKWKESKHGEGGLPITLEIEHLQEQDIVVHPVWSGALSG